MQKNATIIAKMGINSLDIDILTNELLYDNEVNTTNISSINTSTISSINNNKNKNKYENNENNTIETKEDIKKENYQEPTKETININKLKDIHKFLYSLWNEREINIVINLYKELESKQHTEEKINIYDNLMNYCSMKETKLNKYIEQISSVL